MVLGQHTNMLSGLEVNLRCPEKPQKTKSWRLGKIAIFFIADKPRKNQANKHQRAHQSQTFAYQQPPICPGQLPRARGLCN